MGISPRRQLVARSQSTPLERPPRFPLRQVRPLIFPTYTICLTLPQCQQKVVRRIIRLVKASSDGLKMNFSMGAIGQITRLRILLQPSMPISFGIMKSELRNL